MEDLTAVKNMVSTLAKDLSIPVTCKIRVFPQDEPGGKEKTLQYAKMLQDSGCSLLAVHGRTRDQKRCKEIRADWNIIKAVKEHLDIPVLANGDIRHLGDAKRCLELTGCDGVLSAEPLLTNPALFSGQNPPVWQMCEEYLDLAEKYPCPLSYSRGHMFKILHHVLQERN